MTILTLALPLTKPTVTTEFDYVLSVDGSNATDHGTAPLALLPRADSLVLVAPAQALSWHRVRLPPVANARVRAALDGLLEERLLDDPAQLALALVPRRMADGDALVVACDKSWLRASLELFEQGRRPASRVVPEFAPQATDEQPIRLHVIGTEDDAMLVVVQADGVACLPLSSANAAFGDWPIATGDDGLLAEPSVARLAEQVLGRPVLIHPVAQRLLDAGRCEWELAQFDLSITGGGRMARRWQQQAVEFWHAPAWRATRWGLGVLLLANLVGLNAWAWKLDSVVGDKQRGVNALLVSTFPGVRVVVDAPLQMQREVALLRQARGGVAADDMEGMLAALGRALPPGVHAEAVDYAAGELAIRGLDLTGPLVGIVRDKLMASGYRIRVDRERLIVQSESKP